MLIYCPTRFLYEKIELYYRLLRRFNKKIYKRNDKLQLLLLCQDSNTLQKILNSRVFRRVEKEGIILPINGITWYSYQFIKQFGIEDSELEKKLKLEREVTYLPENFKEKYQKLLKSILLYPIII